MKKLFFSALMLMGMSLAVNAEIKISRQYIPIDLEVQVKRCVVSGDQGYIDLVFINRTGKHIKYATLRGVDIRVGFERNKTVAYDDEGNIYEYFPDGSGNCKMYKIIWGADDPAPYETDLPEEVPIKMRIFIKDVSEFATEFTMLNLAFNGISSWSGGAGSITFRNIPITRMD